VKKDPSPLDADRIHAWANLIVGFNLPRRFVRSLGIGRRVRLIEYVNYVWLKANDNSPRRVERPRWLPKRFIWGRRP
jgi:hypothetical protein